MVTSVKRMNAVIEMYGMQDVLTVQECTKGYQVNHKIGDDDYNVYVCRTLDSAAQWVNRIIFDLPIDATSTGGPT